MSILRNIKGILCLLLMLLSLLFRSGHTQGFYSTDSTFIMGNVWFVGDTTTGNVEIHFDSSATKILNLAAFIDSLRAGSIGGAVKAAVYPLYIASDTLWLNYDTNQFDLLAGSQLHVKAAGITATEISGEGEFFGYKAGKGLEFGTGDSIHVDLWGSNSGLERSLTGIRVAGDLRAIEALSGTTGLARKTDTDTWTLDTATYLTAETGDISAVTAGSGLTGGGTTGAVTINAVASTGLETTSDSIKVKVPANSGLISKVAGLYMGTPGSLTGSTTNTISGTSHTHSVGSLTAANLSDERDFYGKYRGRGLYATPDSIIIDRQTNSGLSLLNSGLALGTPTTLTAVTTNAVSGSSHTHAITGFLTAEVDGSTTNEIEVVDEAYSAANFNGGTTSAVSQDDFYDLMHIADADDDGKIAIVDLSSAGFVKTDASGNLSVDGNTYLTAETGDISAVTAGSGLTGGGTTGSVTINAVASTGLETTSDSIKVKVPANSGLISKVAGLYMGTPGSLTGSTTNTISGTSHTHSVSGLTAATLIDERDFYGKYRGRGLYATPDSIIIDRQTNSGLSLLNSGLALGTPTTLTAVTTNAVSGSSHTHAITGFLTAEVDGSTTNEIEVVDEAYSAANFNGGTTSAVSQDDFYDLMHIADADDDGKIAIVDLSSAGFVKTDASGNLSVDGNTYLTAETGDISAVTAGAGMTGGGTTGAVTLDVIASTGLTTVADSVKVNLAASSGLLSKIVGLSLDGTDARNYNWTNETHNLLTTGSITSGSGGHIVTGVGTWTGSTLKRSADNAASYILGGTAWDQGSGLEYYGGEHLTTPGRVKIWYGSQVDDLTATDFYLARKDNGAEIDVLRADINGDITIYDALTTSGQIRAGTIGAGTTWNGNSISAAYLNITADKGLRNNSGYLDFLINSTNFEWNNLAPSTYELRLKAAGIDTNKVIDAQFQAYIRDRAVNGLYDEVICDAAQMFFYADTIGNGDSAYYWDGVWEFDETDTEFTKGHFNVPQSYKANSPISIAVKYSPFTIPGSGKSVVFRICWDIEKINTYHVIHDDTVIVSLPTNIYLQTFQTNEFTPTLTSGGYITFWINRLPSHASDNFTSPIYVHAAALVYRKDNLASTSDPY